MAMYNMDASKHIDAASSGSSELGLQRSTSVPLRCQYSSNLAATATYRSESFLNDGTTLSQDATMARPKISTEALDALCKVRPPKIYRKTKRELNEVTLPAHLKPKQSQVEVNRLESVGAEETQQRELSPANESCFPDSLKRPLHTPLDDTLVYMANFSLHFGVTDAMESFLDDLHRIRSLPNTSSNYSFATDVRLLKSQLLEQYDYTVYYFCNHCCGTLRNRSSICNRAGCRLKGVTPKRTHLANRASLHLVRLLPQLRIVLKSTIDHLIATHKRLHENSGGVDRICSETYDHDLYKESMENHESFQNREMNVILTLYTDGVTFRLSTMEAATTLNDKRTNIPRKRSSGEKHRINETGIAGGSTENTFPVTNTFSEAVNIITGENSLSLVKLGKLIRQFEINFENKEVLATKMKEVNSINLQQIKNVQAAIDSMRPSSDSAVRTLTGIIKEQSNIIAGLSLTIDTILSNQQEHGKQLRKTSYHIAKAKEIRLPEGYEFERKNLTKSWKFNGFPPFKNANMIEFFENWTRPSRAHKHDHFLLVMDFYRFYFLNACEPKQEIQKFACRQSGKKGRLPHLHDLSESLVTFLINFVLDAVGLYAEELQLTATECARKRNRFWLGLGDDDETRTKTFDKLSEARLTWNGLARVAIGRALADVRAYRFDAERQKLSPPSKKRFCPTPTHASLAHEQANEAEHDQDEEIEV